MPSFQALQNAFDSDNTESIQFFLFDLPFFDGYDLTDVPLKERRELLRRLLATQQGGPLHFSENFNESPHRIIDTACKLSLEGVIAKRFDAPYESRRTKTWIKLKCNRRQEFFIAGYTEPKGSRSAFGALLLAVHEQGGQLRYAGRVGTGFDEKILKSVYGRLKKLETARAPQRLGRGQGVLSGSRAASRRSTARPLQRENGREQWNITTLPERLAKMRRDAWASPGKPQMITAAVKKKLGIKSATN